MPMKIAILDDYQRVARDFVDWSRLNVVLTPHLGYVTRENYAVFYRDALEDILAWQADAPVRLLTPH